MSRRLVSAFGVRHPQRQALKPPRFEKCALTRQFVLTAKLSCSLRSGEGAHFSNLGGCWGRLRERAKSYAKALANDILR